MDKRGWNKIFRERFDKHEAELHWDYMSLYNDENAFDYFVEMLQKAYKDRSRTLKAIDRKRLEDADWYDVVNIHLNGFFHTTRKLITPMAKKKWGRVVSVASLSGIKGMPGQTNYSAAKGGVIAATKALALEVAKRRVTVNAVAPGFVETDMTKELDQNALKETIPAGRFGTADEVADLVAFLASDKAAYITGQVIEINGGLNT